MHPAPENIRVKSAGLAVNEHGLHAIDGDNLIPIDGLSADDLDIFRYQRHRIGMNDTMFVNTRIHGYQEVFNNRLISFRHA